jgi:hypothetical protein
MKAKLIISTILSAIIFFLLNCFNEKHENLPIAAYIIIALLSLLFAWTLNYHWVKRIRTHTTSCFNEDVDFEDKIIYKVPMNHIKNKFITNGGIGYLFKNRLVYVSYNNSGKKTNSLEICFENIVSITDFKCFGALGSGLEIKIKSGEVERFILDKSTEFYIKLKSVNYQ